MLEYVYKVSLSLQSPVISQTGGGRKLGVDTAAVFDDHQRPSLPGTLIKGNLRAAWESLSQISPSFLSSATIDSWLGPKPKDEAQAPSSAVSHDRNEPKRSRLRFSHYWKAEAAVDPQRKSLHRIAIDADTGAVRRQALQVIEAPHLPGQTISYQGAIHAVVEDEAESKQLGRLLRKGLEFVPALGAFKGVGFGRILAVEVVSDLAKVEDDDDDRAYDLNGFGITLKLDRPFCFAKPHSADSNRFESEEFIPGAAIKGALAWYLNESDLFDASSKYGKLCEYFDLIRFTHAQLESMEGGKRTLAMPLSWVADEQQGEIHDLALMSVPGLLNGYAPRFQPDWKGKHWEKAKAKLKQKPDDQSPAKALTVRTAIEKGAAKPGQLFAVETVVAGNHDWLADVDLTRVPEEEKLIMGQQLRSVLRHGLSNLGKTKAQAGVDCSPTRHDSVFRSQAQLLQNGTTAVLVLQSAARLFDAMPNIRATNGEKDLKNAYQQVWHKLSGGVLELSHFYARQMLVGGGYLKARFGESSSAYNPDLLTLPGSVFVLKLASGASLTAAEELLKRWLEQGLPQPEYCTDEDQSKESGDWARNPWLAVNGYGEVAVNLPFNWQFESDEKVWEPIETAKAGGKP